MATIVITGANRGIGFSLTKAYAEAGDRVFAWCRDPGRADKLNLLAKDSGGAVTVVEADVTDGASIDRAASATQDAPVDLLLNVAGIVFAENGPEDRNFDNWRKSFEVMTIGPFRVTQALLPNLSRAKGKVVSVSSHLGASSKDNGGLYSYGAAKAGLNRVMKSLAVDLKDRGIAVAVVHPGFVQTDMGGPNADITPMESAMGIKAVASKLTTDNTGSFFKWNGEPHPW
jgi:NAD(P)-dependent dehydrogenase (short-subunit alcohol dehydrogenase family)